MVMDIIDIIVKIILLLIYISVYLVYPASWIWDFITTKRVNYYNVGSYSIWYNHLGLHLV
jgi:hypothetical protein